MIHIYTGNGKGKTTSAFGLAMRASGQGMKVAVFQFLKPHLLVCGEQISAKKLKGVELVAFDQRHPMFEGSCAPSEKLRSAVKKDFEAVKKVILGGRYDMVVLDEIINVLDQGLIEGEGFQKLLKNVPQKVELVLTGRGDTSGIEQFADYVTVMSDKKHPFRKGGSARKGIEY